MMCDPVIPQLRQRSLASEEHDACSILARPPLSGATGTEISHCETAFQSGELHKVLPLSMHCQFYVSGVGRDGRGKEKASTESYSNALAKHQCTVSLSFWKHSGSLYLTWCNYLSEINQ